MRIDLDFLWILLFHTSAESRGILGCHGFFVCAHEYTMQEYKDRKFSNSGMSPILTEYTGMRSRGTKS